MTPQEFIIQYLKEKNLTMTEAVNVLSDAMMDTMDYANLSTDQAGDRLHQILKDYSFAREQKGKD